MNARYPVSSEIVISAGGLSRRSRTWRMIQATASPTPTSACGEEEQATGVERGERAGDHGRDGHSIEDEAGAVVHEALALDDRDELAWDSSRRAIDVAASGSVGETIAPRTNASPRKALDRRVRDDGDTHRRDDDEPDREEADRPHIGPQIAKRREERRAVEQRRQDAEEDELGLELELRHPRNEPDREAAEDEEDRVRDAEAGAIASSVATETISARATNPSCSSRCTCQSCRSRSAADEFSRPCSHLPDHRSRRLRCQHRH